MRWRKGLKTIAATLRCFLNRRPRKMEAVQLLLNDAHGVYIPQNFCEMFDLAKFTGIKQEDIDICLAGPDHKHYWDAWQEITYNATHTDERGNVFRLYQDGDLWLYCMELMTNEEKKNMWLA